MRAYWSSHDVVLWSWSPEDLSASVCFLAESPALSVSVVSFLVASVCAVTLPVVLTSVMPSVLMVLLNFSPEMDPLSVAFLI